MPVAILMALMAAASHREPATVAPEGAQPLGSTSTWFTTKDYPQPAIVAHEQGTVGFQLDIDANGLPSDCHILQSSGSKLLDERTCTIMMARARFRPMTGVVKVRKGKNGKVVASAPGASVAVFRHAMVWKLPGKHEEKLVDRSFDAKSVISASGEVTSCVLSGAGATKLASAGGSCGPFGNRDFFAFFLKDDYKKARGANVRMLIVANGASVPPGDRPPNFHQTLAKADLEIAPTGEMANCTSVTKMEALGHTLDLCEFVRADPPRFPSGPAGRKASIILDLSAYYL
jgi:TonB family protein